MLPLTPASPSAPRLISRAWIVPFAAALLGMMALQMASLGFSPLLPNIQRQFGMSYSQVGLFTGMYGILAMLLSIPAGLAVKRFGEKAVLLGGIVVVAAGIAVLSVAPNITTAFAGRALWIAGYRFAFVSVLTAVALTAPPALRASSMGLLGAVSSMASVVGAPFGSMIGQHFGWRRGMLAFAAASLAGLMIVAIFYRGSGDQHAASVDRIPGAYATRSAFSRPFVWAFALVVGSVGLPSFAVTFFAPTAARIAFGMTAVEASLLISGGYLLAAIINVLAGWLMDRYDKWAGMMLLTTLMVPACFLMTSGNRDVFRMATMATLALAFTATNQVYGLAGDLVPGRETGNVMGVVSLGAGLCGYVGPQLLGILRDRTGTFNAGWRLLGATAAVALLELYVLRRFKKRDSRPRVEPAIV